MEESLVADDSLSSLLRDLQGSKPTHTIGKEIPTQKLQLQLQLQQRQRQRQPTPLGQAFVSLTSETTTPIRLDGGDDVDVHQERHTATRAREPLTDPRTTSSAIHRSVRPPQPVRNPPRPVKAAPAPAPMPTPVPTPMPMPTPTPTPSLRIENILRYAGRALACCRASTSNLLTRLYYQATLSSLSRRTR
jgi:hypothetical protein